MKYFVEKMIEGLTNDASKEELHNNTMGLLLPISERGRGSIQREIRRV